MSIRNTQQQVDADKYGEGYDRIFGKSPSPYGSEVVTARTLLPSSTPDPYPSPYTPDIVDDIRRRAGGVN